MEADVILVDEPAPIVSRITMNRPEKRNALTTRCAARSSDSSAANDTDRAVRVTIIRGAGPSFSAGYDLGGGNEGLEPPYYTPGGEGHWPRHVTEGWMSIWDLAKPVVAHDRPMGPGQCNAVFRRDHGGEPCGHPVGSVGHLERTAVHR